MKKTIGLGILGMWLFGVWLLIASLFGPGCSGIRLQTTENDHKLKNYKCCVHRYEENEEKCEILRTYSEQEALDITMMWVFPDEGFYTCTVTEE